MVLLSFAMFGLSNVYHMFDFFWFVSHRPAIFRKVLRCCVGFACLASCSMLACFGTGLLRLALFRLVCQVLLGLARFVQICKVMDCLGNVCMVVPCWYVLKKLAWACLDNDFNARVRAKWAVWLPEGGENGGRV